MPFEGRRNLVGSWYGTQALGRILGNDFRVMGGSKGEKYSGEKKVIGGRGESFEFGL